MQNAKWKSICLTVLSILTLFCLCLGVACTQHQTEKPPVNLRLEISANELDIDLYGTQELTANVYDGETPISASYTWTVDDDSVIQLVDEKNVATVKGLKVGTATITVKSGDMIKTCACTVTDRTGQIPKLSLNFVSTEIMVDDTVTIIPTVYYDGEPVTGPMDYTFLSENTQVITVMEAVDGLSATLKGVAYGTTNVVVSTTYDETFLQVKAKIVVKSGTAILVSQKEISFERIAPGYDEFMKEVSATIIPEDENDEVDYSKLIWESEDENIATVEKGENGTCIIKNGEAGQTVVTATYTVSQNTILKETITVNVSPSKAVVSTHPTTGDKGLRISLTENEWFQYPKAVNIKDKTLNEDTIVFDVIPTIEGADDFANMYVRFTDATDENNYVEIVLRSHFHNSGELEGTIRDTTLVKAGTSANPGVYTGYTNEKSTYVGSWFPGTFHDSTTSSAEYFRFSYDTEKTSLYGTHPGASKTIVADFKNATGDYEYFPSIWDGFKGDEIYISMRTDGHVVEGGKSTIFLLGIYNIDLSAPSRTVFPTAPGIATEYQEDYTLTVPTGATYYVDNKAYAAGEKVNLGDGLLVNMQGGEVNGLYHRTWCFPYVIDFTEKTKDDIILDFMTVPTVPLAREYDALFIIIRDTEDANNYIKIRLEGRNASNDTRVKAGHSGCVASNGSIEYRGNDNNGGFVESSDINGSRNFRLAIDYEDLAIYAYKCYGGTRIQEMAMLVDLDDPFYFDRSFGGFANGTATIEIELWSINSQSHSTQIFFRTIEDFNLANPEQKIVRSNGLTTDVAPVVMGFGRKED